MPDHKYSIESETIENKTISQGKLPHDLWEPITAFSNADGGIIKLGVEPNGSSTGIEERYLDEIQRDLITQCASAYNHKLYPEITIDKNNVLSVFIPPAPAALRPVYSLSRGLPKGAKVRVGTVNVQLDEEWIRRFSIAKSGGAELVTFPGNTEDYFESKTVEQYLNQIRQKRGNIYKNLSQEEILIKLRAVDQEKRITMFGLLAFSNSFGLQELAAPTVNIAVTQYTGITKVNPDDIEEVSLDDREFNGNTVMQFENALKFIESKLPVRSRIESGGKRHNYLAIPRAALRETLANAIVHRDYTTYSGRIQIDIYSDRIEFANPGRSLIPIELLETAHPETRNPLLMNYLRDWDITEHRGRGIRTIKSSLKESGLAEPTFIHKHDWFVATLYSSAFIKDDDQVWLKQFQQYKLNKHQLNALVHVKHTPLGITNREYREINNMNNVRDDIRAKKELAKLANLGLLEKIGENRYRRYTLGSKAIALLKKQS